ncbi:hypothetical protein, partial [Streptomyces prunicolor]|uniref:hypothetical protein n=1 Tax=Streptomyces prunicolor TaxID=67348 RepID=UPI0033EFB68C
MSSRIDVIAAVLRHPAPVRDPLAYELRGSVVQLLGPGTTDPTWTATPELLAAAVDAGLARAEREEKDIPVGDTADVKGTTSTPGRTAVQARVVGEEDDVAAERA